MYTFRMRAYAAAHFDWDDVLTIGWPDAEAKLQSEYTGGDSGRAYPVTIHGEIRGDGQSIEEAEPRLAGAIGNTLPLIGLASNAAIADPLAIATHGLDLTTPQPFTAYQTPGPDQWFPPGGRRIDLEATREFMHAVGTHPQTELLQRAIETYRRALGHWVPEQHLLAGEFLYISAETLSRFQIESRAADKGITAKNLARFEGLGNEKQLRARYLRNDIFGGDGAALEAMQKASDGFEHGFMSVEDVRGLVESVLEQSMGHVRRALIEASGLDPALRERLLADRYKEPRGLVPAIRFARGELSRQDPSSPPPVMEGAPVEVEWDVKQVGVSHDSEGKVNIAWQTRVTATKLPENTTLGVHSFGMRAAHVTPSGEPSLIEVERAGDEAADPPPEVESTGPE